MNSNTVILILLIAFVGGLLAASFITARGVDQARVSVDGGDVVVKPVGLMHLFAFSAGVRVPLPDVLEATVADRATLPLGWRAPGSYLPKVMCAGTYRRKGSKSLWLVAKSQTVLDIEMKDHHFNRVVAQVADPAAAAALIDEARHLN